MISSQYYCSQQRGEHQPLSEPRRDIVLRAPLAGDSEVSLPLPINRSFSTFGCEANVPVFEDPASGMGLAHQPRAQTRRVFDARCVCLPYRGASKWADNDRFTNARAASRLAPREAVVLSWRSPLSTAPSTPAPIKICGPHKRRRQPPGALLIGMLHDIKRFGLGHMPQRTTATIFWQRCTGNFLGQACHIAGVTQAVSSAD